MTTPPAAPQPGSVPSSGGSQTLDRGLRALAVVCGAAEPVSVAEIAGEVGLHRSIAYRLLQTLEQHQLVQRGHSGRYAAGPGLVLLSGGLLPRWGDRLQALADRTGMTAFVVVAHGSEAVTAQTVEPRGTLAHVFYRPGGRHPLTRGAPGLAILAGRPRQPEERPEVTTARARGWASSRGEVIPGYRSIAAPVPATGHPCRTAVAVVFVEDVDEASVAAAVMGTAAAIGSSVG